MKNIFKKITTKQLFIVIAILLSMVVCMVFLFCNNSGGVEDKQKDEVIENIEEKQEIDSLDNIDDELVTITTEEIDEDFELKAKMDTSDWLTYRNEEYGFKIKLPGDKSKWIVKKRNISKKNNTYNSSKGVYLNFEYKLDFPIKKNKSDDSLGDIEEMKVWYLEIVPIENYIDNACQINNKPMCRQGKVLGKNDKFVFVSGFTNIEGAGYICLDDDFKQQSNFCDIDKYFGLSDINEMLKFSFTK